MMKVRSWKFVSEYPVTKYKCGLKAGDYLKLRHDLPIQDHKGKPTGEIYAADELFGVLTGASEEPVVWLLRRIGDERMTWDDDKSIFETFERIDPESATY